MSVKANVISNYIGQITIAVLNFIFIPTYIKYIGVEAYGLVGMFAVLQMALNTLDGSIIPLISREMSCYLGGTKPLDSLRNLLRTAEIICLTIGIIFIVIVSLLADFLSTNWFIVEKLPSELIAHAIRIAIFVVALRALEDLYKGVLTGLQKQVTQNSIAIICAIFRFVGVIYALKYFDSTIKTFYYWQLLSSIITTFTYVVVCYKSIPGMLTQSRFKFEEIKNNLSFTIGSFSFALSSFINTQADKIIISKLLPLTEVAYYTLASSITNVLLMVSHPVTLAFYPKIITLRSQEQHEAAALNYHLKCQIINLTCGVAAFSLIFYGNYIIGYWTQDSDLTANVMPYVRLLAISMYILINANTNLLLPYIAGKPIISGKISGFSIILVICITIPLAYYFKSYGAAFGNIIQNTFIFLAFPLCFNCYLKSEQTTWFIKDFLIPTLTIAMLFYISTLCSFVTSTDLTGVITCVLIAIIILVISSFTCDKLREKINLLISPSTRNNIS